MFMKLIKDVSSKVPKASNIQKYILITHFSLMVQLDIMKTVDLTISNQDGHTSSCLHKAQWQEYMTCYNRKRVLRVAKMVLSRYINKLNNSNTFSKESLIPSYWIKKMCAHHPNDSSWNDELLYTRVLELLSILTTCLDHKQLYSYFSHVFLQITRIFTNKLSEILARW